jgi:AraC-like DNA-binding protein
MVSGQMRNAPRSPNFPLINELRDKAVFSVMSGAIDEPTKGLHRHPHGLLLLLQSGHVKSHSEAGRWLIPAGHLCWVPPFTRHYGENNYIQGVRIYLAAKFCKQLPKQACVVWGTPLVVAIIERFAACAGLHKALSDVERRLLGVLFDEIERVKSVAIALPMPQDATLSRVAERLLRRLDDRTGLDKLATEAGMSRRSFTRNFKRATGLPVGEWRQVARLMQGVDMLATGKSVTETAFALGYDSLSSFVALCQRHTGMSPKSLAHLVSPGERKHHAQAK